jgi:hypothetical protein
MTLLRTLLLVGAMLGVHSTGCGSSGTDGPSKKSFAACCTTAADCASNVCGDDQHVCTQTCAADADCPPEPKSGTAKCSSKGVCEGETKDLDCEHPGGSQGAGGALASGGATGTAGTGGGIGSGGLASGGASNTGGKSGSGGKSATGGASGGGIGIGDPCSTDAACESGICYRPGGPPGFCTTTCSVSFDAACSGSSSGGQNASGEYVYCMPFGGGGRCFPGCVNSPTVCSKFLGVTCTSVKDIANYGGKVCTETL